MIDRTVILIGAGAIVVAVAALIALRARFTAKPILNHSEKRLFWDVQRIMRDQPGRYLLCPQVSYGEILASKSKRAFWSINARRADMVICDNAFNPIAVIEYQGSGHYGNDRRDQKSAKVGDRAKRRALASAGIPIIEVESRYKTSDLKRQLIKHLGSSAIGKGSTTKRAGS